MLAYTLRRVLFAIPVLIGVMFIIFWILWLSPARQPGPPIGGHWPADDALRFANLSLLPSSAMLAPVAAPTRGA